jgi:hypothetical protein
VHLATVQTIYSEIGCLIVIKKKSRSGCDSKQLAPLCFSLNQLKWQELINLSLQLVR